MRHAWYPTPTGVPCFEHHARLSGPIVGDERVRIDVKSADCKCRDAG